VLTTERLVMTMKEMIETATPIEIEGNKKLIKSEKKKNKKRKKKREQNNVLADNDADVVKKEVRNEENGAERKDGKSSSTEDSGPPLTSSKKSKKKKKRKNKEEETQPEAIDSSSAQEEEAMETPSNTEGLIEGSTDKKSKKKQKKRDRAGEEAEATDQANDASQEGEKRQRTDTEDQQQGNEEQGGNVIQGFFSEQKFEALPISDNMKKGLAELEFEKMTKIQAKGIGPLLAGEDLVGAAKTGSGKTLAFLIPVIELLNKTNFSHRNGTGCIIISPTRELSLQIYGVLQELCGAGGFPQTHGLLIGGANRRTEAEKLSRGVNIVVCTPGRLLDHLQNTKAFLFSNLQALVLDEADRMLEQGFEEELHQIIKILPKERQTILFSATQTKKVEDLAKLSIQKRPIYVGVDDEDQSSTVSTLEQGYVTCPSDKRFLLLFTFLKKNRNKKVMVFFSSCNSVKYHSELLNYIDIPVMDIHGRQKQQKRTTTFFQFCRQKTGILLCTDVAARGLDIPAVDWIVQYDPPDQPAEYIHRVGRTARGASGKGRALLFLCPEEVGFLKYLRAAKVSLNEYEFPVSKIANVGSQLCRLVEKNYYLNRSAREAFKSYLLAYASHAHKNIFNVHELDLQAVAKAFGFTVPPRVDLNFSAKGAKGRIKKGQKKKGEFSKGGHNFSATNPYGKREAGDRRQFSY